MDCLCKQTLSNCDICPELSRNFVSCLPRMAAECNRLNALLGKDGKFVSTAENLAIMQDLKAAMSWERPFRFETDASLDKLSAVVVQVQPTSSTRPRSLLSLSKAEKLRRNLNGSRLNRSVPLLLFRGSRKNGNWCTAYTSHRH